MSQTTTEDEIDLRALLAVLLTYWKMILAMLLLGLAAGVFYTKNATPIYTTNGLIQVDKKVQGVAALGGDVANLLQAPPSGIQTEIELIKSRMVLWPVINSLHLDIAVNYTETHSFKKLLGLNNNSSIKTIHTAAGVGTVDGRLWIAEFNVPKNYYDQAFTLSNTDGQHFELKSADGLNLKGTINSTLSAKTPSGTISLLIKALPSGEPLIISKQAPSSAIDGLKSSLTLVEQGQQTGILYATLNGVNQDEITETLTKIFQNYKQQSEDTSTAETTKTLAFMQEQLPKLKSKLDEAQATFNKFREQNGTVDIDKESELAITERGEIQKSLRELELKQAELKERYTDEYPVLKQLNAQIDELRKKEASLNDGLTRIPEVQRQFIDLSSDVKISSEIYLNMLKNYEQLQIVKSGQIGYVRLVDLPISTYQPIAPKKPQIILLASLLGLMLGVGLAFVKSLFNSSVKDVDALENALDLPVIGVIPHTAKVAKFLRKNGKKSVLLDQIEPEGITNEAIKSIRTHLIFNLKNKTGNKLMLTSAGPSVGKSFISANLAVELAQAGKKVLLIDADARLGYLEKYFTQVNSYGLVDYLLDGKVDAEQVILQELIQQTAYENLAFISRGKYHHKSSELFLNGRLQDLLERVSGYYDYILLDTSPVMGTSDALAIGQLMDRVLFITRYGVSTVKQVDFAIERLNRSEVTVQGLILNDTQQSVISDYNYSYGYAYKAKK